MRHCSGNDPDKFRWSEARGIFLRIGLGLGAVYFLVAIGAHLLSLRMIFPRPPLRYELTADYVQLTAPDGVTLVGRFWRNPTSRFTVLYLHGNYEDLGRVGEYVPQFLRSGYSVFAIDYRNYGHSGGTPTEINTYADAQLAFGYVRDTLHVPTERIIIWGYSLGWRPGR